MTKQVLFFSVFSEKDLHLNAVELYKKCTAKPRFFLVIDTILVLNNPLRFRKNLLVRIPKIMMTTDDKIRDKKLQHDINGEAAALLSNKTEEKKKNNLQVKKNNIPIKVE